MNRVILSENKLQMEKTEIEGFLRKQTDKQQNYVQLESDIEEIRTKVQNMLQAKDDEIVALKDLPLSQLKSTTIKQWINEMKDRFMTELAVLSDNTMELQTSCGVLQERLRILELVER